VNGASSLRDVYTLADPTYTGRVTVPVLRDRRRGTIVDDESAEIARTLDDAFDDDATRDVDLYPRDRRDETDSIVEAVHEDVNLAVYRAGFADSQREYERAVRGLFEALDDWDAVLGERRFLAGDRLTLADVFVFPTLYRFEAVYHTHFGCNRRRLVDYDDLWPYARELFGLTGVAATCDESHVKAHYYRSHDDLDPSGIVPVGSDVDWAAPDERERLGGSLPDALQWAGVVVVGPRPRSGRLSQHPGGCRRPRAGRRYHRRSPASDRECRRAPGRQV
jgi:putative glutathione S-transferase